MTAVIQTLTSEREQGALWTQELSALWLRIEAHEFDAAQQLSFTRRLARDHRWTLAFAQAAVREYRRFCFLSVAAPLPVTPSEQVDEVWHQHLTYTRDYWNVWCRDVLGIALHHDPTQGGPIERSRFRKQYAQTLATYERFFGPPPEIFWPGTQERFRARPRFRIQDTHRWWPLLWPGQRP